MAEAVGLAASILTLVSTPYQSCKVLNDTITSIDEAPKHVYAMADDLADFYHLLGTLQIALAEDDYGAGIIEPAMSGHLSQVLRHCVGIFKTTSMILAEYDDRSKSSASPHFWKRMKWTFKEKEIEEARKELVQCKLTLNMAISVANWYNVRSSIAIASQVNTTTSNMEKAIDTMRQDMAGVVQELEAKLPNIIEDLENLKATQGQQPPQHNARDRSLVKEDLHFALRQYLRDDKSTLSDCTRTREPSMQVSSFGDGISYFTSIYRTAQTHMNSEAETTGNLQIPGRYMTLYIGILGKITPVQIQPHATFHELATVVIANLNLPFVSLQSLWHKGRSIYGNNSKMKLDLPLSRAMIPPDSELFCLMNLHESCGHELFWSADGNHTDPCQYCQSRQATKSDDCTSSTEDPQRAGESCDSSLREARKSATSSSWGLHSELDLETTSINGSNRSETHSRSSPLARSWGGVTCKVRPSANSPPPSLLFKKVYATSAQR